MFLHKFIKVSAAVQQLVVNRILTMLKTILPSHPQTVKHFCKCLYMFEQNTAE